MTRLLLVFLSGMCDRSIMCVSWRILVEVDEASIFALRGAGVWLLFGVFFSKTKIEKRKNEKRWKLFFFCFIIFKSSFFIFFKIQSKPFLNRFTLTKIKKNSFLKKENLENGFGIIDICPLLVYWSSLRWFYQCWNSSRLWSSLQTQVDFSRCYYVERHAENLERMASLHVKTEKLFIKHFSNKELKTEGKIKIFFFKIFSFFMISSRGIKRCFEHLLLYRVPPSTRC